MGRESLAHRPEGVPLMKALLIVCVIICLAGIAVASAFDPPDGRTLPLPSPVFVFGAVVYSLVILWSLLLLAYSLNYDDARRSARNKTTVWAGVFSSAFLTAVGILVLLDPIVPGGVTRRASSNWAVPATVDVNPVAFASVGVALLLAGILFVFVFNKYVKGASHALA